MTAFAMLPSNDYDFTLYPVTPDSRCPDDPSSYSDHWDPMLAASYHADLDRLSASIPSDMYPDHESIFDDDLIVFPRNNSHDNNNNPWCHSSSHPSCNPLATQQTLLVPSWTPGSAFSAPSTMSSTVDSPSMQWIAPHPVVGPPSMGQQHVMDHDMLATCAFDLDQPAVANGAFVDPALILPTVPSLRPIDSSMNSPPQSASRAVGSASPNLQVDHGRPRRHSVSSEYSRQSGVSEDSKKGLCLIPACGRHVKDLKAHMLTHQIERPEKCPMATCEWHTKGFARKYDKNRHTLKHYKGTMVCGFCPGSGSATEKTFNRADVFKRHLTSVHGVEQTPSSARRRSPSAAATVGGTQRRVPCGTSVPATCSTCGVTFVNAQEFYDHLDDCVLRVVQQTDPGEAINERLLSSIAQDPAARQTLERHGLSPHPADHGPTSADMTSGSGDDDADTDDDDGPSTYGTLDARSSRKSTMPSRVASPTATSSSFTIAGKRRKDLYPLSWGAGVVGRPGARRMKKRVLCVFDGPRRLWKDDMMLDAAREVRVPLGPDVGDGRAWVTDLDAQTQRRAEGVLGATQEEKAEWGVDESHFRALMG